MKKKDDEESFEGSYCAEGRNPTSKLGITESMGGGFFKRGVALILSLCEEGLKLILLNEKGL